MPGGGRSTLRAAAMHVRAAMHALRRRQRDTAGCTWPPHCYTAIARRRSMQRAHEAVLVDTEEQSSMQKCESSFGTLLSMLLGMLPSS